jgi:hypothetical protein
VALIASADAGSDGDGSIEPELVDASLPDEQAATSMAPATAAAVAVTSRVRGER